eukprot:CAMPEP_0173421802 /NCGR_PEP_ID=MMETSP1357-20121228/2772_1 /TAXON_ID=77926 /ORGANISM="Hemiselmis rufescens, Strain PCC563" /LENGTH=48 /DNA_ID= /DNA_START= /DNA_END= /DNA_ORIENTATION=
MALHAALRTPASPAKQNVVKISLNRGIEPPSHAAAAALLDLTKPPNTA